MSRVQDWVREQKQATETEETRLTIRLDAQQHDDLMRIARVLNINKTACATGLLIESIKDALAAIQDKEWKTEPDAAHTTAYDRIRVSSAMSDLYRELEMYALHLGSDVEINPKVTYVGFKRRVGTKAPTFAYVHINRDSIFIDVKPVLPLQSGFVEAAPDSAKTCTRRIFIRNIGHLEAVKLLLRQCYDLV